ncbi:MAG: hypothetical protein IJ601_04590 [Acidaminococcaceae bacterium]|nr:hypothetical protein [Acidaminococcaceae bacterium]
MFGYLIAALFIGAAVYGIGDFLFHVGPDFALGLISFWIGFYYDVLKKNKTENDKTLAKVAYGICALCFIRGFFV